MQEHYDILGVSSLEEAVELKAELRTLPREDIESRYTDEQLMAFDLISLVETHGPDYLEKEMPAPEPIHPVDSDVYR